MSNLHPLAKWAENRATIAQIALAVRCSDSHLRNIIAGRKEPSLGLADRLSKYTAGEVPVAAFLHEPAQAAE